VATTTLLQASRVSRDLELCFHSLTFIFQAIRESNHAAIAKVPLEVSDN
jgi:hypothetical protein